MMKNNLLKKAMAELQSWKDLWYGKPKKQIKEKKKNETNKTSKFDLRGLGKQRRSKR